MKDFESKIGPYLVPGKLVEIGSGVGDEFFPVNLWADAGVKGLLSKDDAIIILGQSIHQAFVKVLTKHGEGEISLYSLSTILGYK